MAVLGRDRSPRPLPAVRRPPRVSCSRTSARSRRTSAAWTGPPARRSPPGRAPRANCSPSWSAAAPNIASSDQGRSFQAFYDFLLSETRQDELADLLDAGVSRVDASTRTGGCAPFTTTGPRPPNAPSSTVRQISEQLRRFLDDQVWLENRRVLDLVRAIEASALGLSATDPPTLGLEVDEPGIEIALPFERPLYDRPSGGRGRQPASTRTPTTRSTPTALFSQTFVDQARLADNYPRRRCPSTARPCWPTSSRSTRSSRVPPRSSATWRSHDDDVEVEMDEQDETVLDYRRPGRSGHHQAGAAAEGDGDAADEDRLTSMPSPRPSSG